VAKDKEPVDQISLDRQEELARQQKVRDAVAKHELEARAEAAEILRRQRVYETTGIRTVEGKP
jgi:hypothetical protein